ncbi:MAG TPA: hypothetical protein VHA37_10080, partial [Candidatus Saccharimonadales bacterium]|nr:hypothetical protein [Candidatus Saccharimonadales bacterium]
MLVLKGVSALSAFRTKKLLARLQAADPKISGLSAEYVHFADTSQPLTTAQSEQLERLVSYGTPFTGSDKGELYLVVPRPGTISPWSSKATDIARNSGLDSVRRLERGVAYYIRGGKASDRSAI